MHHTVCVCVLSCSWSYFNIQYHMSRSNGSVFICQSLQTVTDVSKKHYDTNFHVPVTSEAPTSHIHICLTCLRNLSLKAMICVSCLQRHTLHYVITSVLAFTHALGYMDEHRLLRIAGKSTGSI
jgi:hypothetical protein